MDGVRPGHRRFSRHGGGTFEGGKICRSFFLELGKDLLEMVDPTQLENLEEICHIGLSFFLEEQKSSPTFSANGCSEDVDNEDFGDRVSRGSLKKKLFVYCGDNFRKALSKWSSTKLCCFMGIFQWNPRGLPPPMAMPSKK